MARMCSAARRDPMLAREPLSPGERVLSEARRLADRKTELTGEALRYALITLLLLVFIFPVGVVVMLWWGWGLAREIYEVVIEPRVREKFVEKEVENQVQATLSVERKALEGRHARSLEHLSASIAHEIRNPITAAKSLVQQMEEEPTAAENVEYARVALEELQRVERSVSHLLRFAREEDLGFTEVRMSEVVESALETFRDRAARSGVEIVRRIDCAGTLVGDAEKLRRIVINLVGNAVDALDESQTPSPRVEVQMGENLAGSEVWVRVRDNGPGIDAETRERMFSPFYTSKEGGTGLGLAITRKLVEAHRGTIEVHSEPGAGAEFLVTLPVQPPREPEEVEA